MNNRFYVRQRKLLTFVLISTVTLLSYLSIQSTGSWAQSAASPVVWVSPSLERVGKTDRPKSEKNINLYAARGEYESFQVVVSAPPSDLTNVNVTVSDLRSPAGKVIPKQNITLYREHYVYVRTPTTTYGYQPDPSLGKGWYPDGLIPFVDPQTKQAPKAAALKAVPFNVIAKNNQPIWIDVFVPRGTTAGQYNGKFTVSSNQGKSEGNIALTVGKFELPLKPSLNSSFAFWDAKSKGNDVELLKHRLMPKDVNPADERSLINEWGLKSTDLGFWSGANYQTCKMDAAPAVADIKSRKAQHQSDLLIYNYSADEIDNCPDLDPILRQWAENLHQAGVKNLVTMKPRANLASNSAVDGKPAVDIWVVMSEMYNASVEQINNVIKKGSQVWSFNALMYNPQAPNWQIDFLPINFRIQPGFIHQSLGLNGLLYWRVDLWTKDPWNDIQTFKNTENYGFPGEGMLFYPGNAVGVSGVVPSMRLKWLRDGVEDYEYVEVLKKKGRGSWAIDVSKTVGPNWKDWTRDPKALAAARQKLSQEIDRLS